MITLPVALEPAHPRRWAGVAASRRRLLVICATVVVATALLTGILIAPELVAARRQHRQPSVSPQTTSSGASTVKEAGGLPVSAPLTRTQLIVPVLTGDNWDLWLADTQQPGPVLRLTTDSAPDTTPAISPDARTLIYTHDLDAEQTRVLLVKGAATAGDGRPLFNPVPEPCRGNVFRPAWNPVRHDELAVPCVGADGKYGLYRITIEGRILGAVPLPPGTGRVDDPSYSPDGKRLVFWAGPPSTWDGGTLYTVPRTGGKPKVLVKTTRAGEDADPVWAPDGKHIVFRRRLPGANAHGNYEIFRVSTDRSARLEQLTHEKVDEQDPTYSPSGDSIAYKSAARNPAHPNNAISRTWIMDADGRNKRVLWTEGPERPQTAAAWGRR